MIPGLGAVDFANPQQTIQNAHTVAKGAVQLLGYAAGLTETDLDNLTVKNIPAWVTLSVVAAAGAIAFSRWAPERWIGRVRTFGR